MVEAPSYEEGVGVDGGFQGFALRRRGSCVPSVASGIAERGLMEESKALPCIKNPPLDKEDERLMEDCGGKALHYSRLFIKGRYITPMISWTD